MQMELRSVSLVVLAALASIFTLYWARAVFIPVMLGLVCSYALSPLVDWLQRQRVPRALGAALVVLSIVSGVTWAAYGVSDDAAKLVELLPTAVQKLRTSIRTPPGKPDNALTTVQKAATQLEQVAADTTGTAPLTRGVQRVQVEKPGFDIRDHLWSGTMGLLAGAGQVGVVVLLAFFLLASGDHFRRKLVKLAGPTLSAKKITLQALNQIDAQIQRYLLVQLFTSTVVGVVTWLCFLAIGMEHAAVWGIAAGLLDLVPYFGSVIITCSSMLVGFLQFGAVGMVGVVGGIVLLIHSAEAFLLTPWLSARSNQMNPFAIFVGVLAWGWLWGVWGLLLGVPILVIIKAICDRVDDFKPVGEFLGD